MSHSLILLILTALFFAIFKFIVKSYIFRWFTIFLFLTLNHRIYLISKSISSIQERGAFFSGFGPLPRCTYLSYLNLVLMASILATWESALSPGSYGIYLGHVGIGLENRFLWHLITPPVSGRYGGWGSGYGGALGGGLVMAGRFWWLLLWMW